MMDDLVRDKQLINAKRIIIGQLIIIILFIIVAMIASVEFKKQSDFKTSMAEYTDLKDNVDNVFGDLDTFMESVELLLMQTEAAQEYFDTHNTGYASFNDYLETECPTLYFRLQQVADKIDTVSGG